MPDGKRTPAVKAASASRERPAARVGRGGPSSKPPRRIAADVAPPLTQPVAPQEPAGTRERILAAAEAEFAAHGFRGARVQQIVARAGVNERMLYHHFGDKQGLYFAVMHSYLVAAAAQFEATMEATTRDPVERLRSIIQGSFDALAQRPTMLRLFLHEALAGWPSEAKLWELRQGIDARLTPKLLEFFADAERAGIFRDGVDPFVALIVAGSSFLMFFVAQPRIERVFGADLSDPAQLAALRDRFIETALYGVVAPRRPSP